MQNISCTGIESEEKWKYNEVLKIILNLLSIFHTISENISHFSTILKFISCKRIYVNSYSSFSVCQILDYM